MFKVPIHFPLRAIRRIVHQAPHCGPMHSCQAELDILVSSGPDLLAWQIAQTEDYMFVQVTDEYEILPYSTLELQIYAFSSGGGTGTEDWTIDCEVGDLDTADQVAVKVAAAINAWVQLKISQPTRSLDVKSMRAIAVLASDRGPSTVKWYMPWGMLGNPNISQIGPLDEGTTLNGEEGVDNPLMIGIVQKRLHVFGARYPYRDDYYGDPPDIG